MTDVDNALGFALGVMFVNETFDKKTKPEAEKMIKLITKAFRWKQILIQVQRMPSTLLGGGGVRLCLLQIPWMPKNAVLFYIFGNVYQ